MNLYTMSSAMLIYDCYKYIPSEWTRHDDLQMEELYPHSSEYDKVENLIQGRFLKNITKIVRVENVNLYGKFLLKKAEYETRGQFRVEELLHDTAACKVHSIVSTNFDWRRSNRVRFGRGVSFSPSATYANKQSSRDNGTHRAMIVADVLIGTSTTVGPSYTPFVGRVLPPKNSDTTVGNNGKVYVKYYDNEFYPKYVAYYTNRQ